MSGSISTKTAKSSSSFGPVQRVRNLEEPRTTDTLRHGGMGEFLGRPSRTYAACALLRISRDDPRRLAKRGTWRPLILHNLPPCAVVLQQNQRWIRVQGF